MENREQELLKGIKNALYFLLDTDAMGTRQERTAIQWLYPLLTEDERHELFNEFVSGMPSHRQYVADHLNALEKDIFWDNALTFS